MRAMGLDCVLPDNRVRTERILDHEVRANDALFDEDIARAIYELWQDPLIPDFMANSGECCLMDNAQYFGTKAQRIGKRSYIPTDTDAFCAQEESTGITEMRFALGPLSIRMCDVGGQSDSGTIALMMRQALSSASRSVNMINHCSGNQARTASPRRRRCLIRYSTRDGSAGYLSSCCSTSLMCSSVSSTKFHSNGAFPHILVLAVQISTKRQSSYSGLSCKGIAQTQAYFLTFDFFCTPFTHSGAALVPA